MELKNLYVLLGMVLIVAVSCSRKENIKTDTTRSKPSIYLQNRLPLSQKPYLELPLGAIKPTGWLLEQLERMKDGMTGHLDEIYPEVLGKRNGWLGGDGDGWERGPYWLDGLLPLAYILDDDSLKTKVQPWIEWTLNNQRPNGYIGPIPFVEPPKEEEGIQRGKRRDWWPKMVMLKVLQQYYDATGDERVITALTKYFKFQLSELKEKPLDNWSVWGNRRGGDNSLVALWLYNITGDSFLLDLGELLASQTFPWTEVFLNKENHIVYDTPWYWKSMKEYPFNQQEIDNLTISQYGGMHCVNLSQGIKQPLVVFQQSKDKKHLEASAKALDDIRHFHGQPQGMFGGDEPLHGKDPLKGVEFCSISEFMFSLEKMLSITGDMRYADLLEKIANNALPTQATDDFKYRQYFQAANQIEVSDKPKPTYQSDLHHHTDFVFGILSGYACCTTNMHQAWPKYVQNLWYATPDGGVAALLYAPSVVDLKVGEGLTAKITETTGFPFRDQVGFTINLDRSGSFPFHLRIPNWSGDAEILVNDKKWEGHINNGVAVVDRIWNDGDQISLRLPMQLKVSKWFEFAVSIERGPLVYALKLEEDWQLKDQSDKYGAFYEVYTKDKWNYALFNGDLESLVSSFEVVENEWDGSYPWNIYKSPIQLKARAIELPDWKLVNGTPYFPSWWGSGGLTGEISEKDKFEDITLMPYGTTTLRISEFPVYGLRAKLSNSISIDP